IAPLPMSWSIRKLPATTRPGKGSRRFRAGSCSCGGLMGGGATRDDTPASAFVNRRAAAPGVAAVTSIAETNTEIARRLDRIRIERHSFHDRDGLFHQYRYHVRRLIRDDVAELSLLDHAHRR